MKSIRRYTTLPVLLDMIERQCLTLLPPDSWADRNDREVMEENRIIFESKDDANAELKEKKIKMSKESIRSITLSQDMPESVFKSIKAQLGKKLGKRISRSTLFENKVWINKFREKTSTVKEP